MNDCNLHQGITESKGVVNQNRAGKAAVGSGRTEHEHQKDYKSST